MEFLATNPTPEEKEEFLNKMAQENQALVSFDNPIEDRLERLKSWAGDYDKAGARSILERVIGENDLLIFGQSGCEYTIGCKQLLDEAKIPYTARDFDSLPNRKEGYALHAELAEMVNRTSVPIVFLKGECIGGFNDGPGLKALVESGEVQEQLGL